MPVPHAADAGNIDVAMLRRSWPSLIDHLANGRQMILKAILESATVASYDGATLELAFPPDRKVGPQKVTEKQDELQAALGDLFGIKPTVTCVVREFREPAGEPPGVEIVEEDEVPDEAEALRRVQEMLGAQAVVRPTPRRTRRSAWVRRPDPGADRPAGPASRRGPEVGATAGVLAGEGRPRGREAPRGRHRAGEGADHVLP